MAFVLRAHIMRREAVRQNVFVNGLSFLNSFKKGLSYSNLFGPVEMCSETASVRFPAVDKRWFTL